MRGRKAFGTETIHAVQAIWRLQRRFCYTLLKMKSSRWWSDSLCRFLKSWWWICSCSHGRFDIFKNVLPVVGVTLGLCLKTIRWDVNSSKWIKQWAYSRHTFTSENGAGCEFLGKERNCAWARILRRVPAAFFCSCGELSLRGYSVPQLIFSHCSACSWLALSWPRRLQPGSLEFPSWPKVVRSPGL